MSAAYYPQVQKIYVAYYGRPADPAGLQYWAGQLAANGGNLTSIINAFGNSAESTALYAGASDSAKVTAIYQQLFNRAPDSAGLAFYTAELTAGRMTAASIALNVANGAQGTDATYLANKVTVGTAFTDALTVDSAAAVAYTGTTAITSARSLITGVTTSAATTNVASTITSIKSGGGAAAGQTFTLTTDTDVPALTSGNDTINGAVNSLLQSADIIIDRSISDSDVLQAVVNVATTAPRIQNIETLNISGLYSTTGLDLASVSGSKALNLSAGVAGATATVANASTLNAEKINAGTNIGTLNVTATASGTRDTVIVDGGKATTVSITGGAGADYFEIKAADAAKVVVKTASSNVDTYKIVTTGGTLTLDGNSAAKTVTLHNTGKALSVTLTDNQTIVGTGTSSKWDVTGDADVTLVVADDGAPGAISDIAGIALTNSGSGKVTLNIKDTASTAAADFSEMAVNTIQFSGTGTDLVTAVVNENAKVELTGDIAADDTVTLGVDDGNPSNAAYAAGEGTLNLVVSESQTKAIATDATVGVVVLSAKADKASDTQYGKVLTLAELDTKTGTKTETVVISGSENLTITKWSADATSSVLSAAAMTGKLTIGDITEASTLVLGSGNDSITSTTDKAFTVYAGKGNDTIDFDTTVATASTVFGEEGDDTITGGTAGDTINGGAGADLILASTGGTDTVTLGDGSDVIEITSAKAKATTDTLKVTDFVAGTDKLILVGAAALDVDLTKLTPASDVYTFDTNFVVTLDGNTATTLAKSVQLGKLGGNFTVANGKTIVASDFADFIAAGAAASSVTITTGAGSDVVYVAQGAGVTTVKDFTMGTDKIVLTGTTTTTAALSLASALTPTAGAYVVGSTNTFSFTLTDATATDLRTFVALGDSKNQFTMTADKSAVGGNFADNIKLGVAAGDTVSVTGGLGADLISMATGSAKIQTVVVAAGDSTISGYDQVTLFDISATAANNDKLDLPATNIATGLGQVAVGQITSASISNGIVTFNKTYIDNSNLQDVLNFLATNVVGTDTVAFVYNNDLNGDGDTGDTIDGVAESQSTFVFQSGTTDTVVQLVGIVATALGTTAATGSVTIA